MIVNDLEKEIKGANRWLDNNPDIILLFTQKEGVKYLINNINSKEKQLRKSLQQLMLESLKDGHLNNIVDDENKDEIEEIINEISDKVSGNNKFTVKFSNKDWEVHKPYKLQTTDNDNNALIELTGYINAIAKLLIEISDSPNKLSDNLHNELSKLLDRIDEKPAMTFDEEANKLFIEAGVLLVEKCHVDPISISNENGIAVTNKVYQENWELCLYWLIAKNNFCRCFLQGSSNNAIIIGKENNVKAVTDCIESEREKIMKLGVIGANQILYTRLLDLKTIKIKMLASGEILEKPQLWLSRYFLKIGVEFEVIDEREDVIKLNSEKDDSINSRCLSAMYHLISDKVITSTVEMRNNNDEINAYIKEKFPNLGHKVIHF